MHGIGHDRLGPDDLTLLAAEASGARMQFAAVAVLDGSPGLAGMRELIACRIGAVPRLRQRLVRVPAGRPVWVQDADFDLDRRLDRLPCPPPGDRVALLGTVARIVEQRLSLARPPWRIVLVDGLAGGRSALVVALHHVLADGVAGLAILSRLVDPAVPATTWPLPADRPRSRPRHVRVRAVAAELLCGGVRLAPACSLNTRPVGPRRALAVADADLGAVRAAARAVGGTVNDVALAAVTGALRDLLAGRGERPDRLVVSVPISTRRRAEVGDLGNRVGVLPVSVPLGGPPRERLGAVATITRARKTGTPGASAALYGPFVRLLAGVGAFGWFVGHQRLVNTFLTNVRGPAGPLAFGGLRIAELIPVSAISGNVSVAFAVAGYAGRLTVTAIADPDRFTDVAGLGALVQGQLDTLTGRPSRS